jgi:SHS family sialic acid transporter-like MFS transporter
LPVGLRSTSVRSCLGPQPEDWDLAGLEIDLVAPEAWSNMSRPLIAGVLGTSANIGLFLMATLASQKAITPADWRWSVLIGGLPVALGLFALLVVPESPRWLAAKTAPAKSEAEKPAAWEVFRPPLLRITLIGIALATVPMIGGWGSANWMIPLADKAGLAADPPNPFLKAHVGQVRSVTGIMGSLLGGWIACHIGRRRTYFLVSRGSLLISQYTFWRVFPTDPSFLYWVAFLGFFSGIYFGWLPLFLPELFPTRVRWTGSGVSFNFGRILIAVTVFATDISQRYAGPFF